MNKRIVGFVFSLLILFGCEKDFSVWKDANDTWLEDNKARLGVDEQVIEHGVTTSGLQYEIYHRGYGPVPKRASSVVVSYGVDLFDGTHIQSNANSVLYVGELIEGFQEAICMVPQGSHIKFYIPYNLAYGKEGREGGSRFSIPPYSVLIYDVELIDVIQVAPVEEY